MLLAVKGCLILLVALAFHVCRDDAILDGLEVVADCVARVEFALGPTIEELTGVHLVLRSCVADFILEELLLGLLERWIGSHVLRHAGHVVHIRALCSARLLQLRIVQLAYFLVIFAAIEFSVGLHHWFLFVLGKLAKTTSGSIVRVPPCNAHLLSARLGKG